MKTEGDGNERIFFSSFLLEIQKYLWPSFTSYFLLVSHSLIFLLQFQIFICFEIEKIGVDQEEEFNVFFSDTSYMITQKSLVFIAVSWLDSTMQCHSLTIVHEMRLNLNLEMFYCPTYRALRVLAGIMVAYSGIAVASSSSLVDFWSSLWYVAIQTFDEFCSIFSAYSCKLIFFVVSLTHWRKTLSVLEMNEFVFVIVVSNYSCNMNFCVSLQCELWKMMMMI